MEDQTDQQTDDATDAEQTDQHTDSQDDAELEGAEDLGDAGKRALDAMKAKWRAERDRARDLAKQLADATKPAAKDDAPDPEAIRAEARREAQDAANARIVRAEVKAAAAGRLADPGDAHRFLDLSQFEVDDDGNVDGDEIADAIDDLLKKKPYLAAAQGQQRRFQGSADSGARKEKPKTLNDQIAEAQASGDHRAVMRLKSRQALAVSNNQ